MSAKLLVYGANGYTGTLIAELAKERGLQPILAGRNGPAIEALAARLGMDRRVFGLDTPSTVDACLKGVGAVLHCAGPFSRTSKPMVEACLRKGVHYLDITGEVAVFEACAARDAEAKAAGVMLMPGVGFDVVPSDCLALHVARRVETPKTLRLAILGVGTQMSHGTATTMVEGLALGSWVRRDGVLTKVPSGSIVRRFDFGRGPRPCMAVPWGDLATAYRSTGAPDIETYFAASRSMIWGARVFGRMPRLMGAKAVQRLLKKRIDARPAGPSAIQRDKAYSLMVVEVEGEGGQRATSRLQIMEGYSLTAFFGLQIAQRALAGDAPVGYQTPAMAYGPDLILEAPKTERVDL